MLHLQQHNDTTMLSYSTDTYFYTIKDPINIQNQFSLAYPTNASLKLTYSIDFHLDLTHTFSVKIFYPVNHRNH
jgi:hypothetical protein